MSGISATEKVLIGMILIIVLTFALAASFRYALVNTGDKQSELFGPPLPPTADTSLKFQQSLTDWCVTATDAKWTSDQAIAFAQANGFHAVELLPHTHWEKAEVAGLFVSMGFNGMDPPFVKGLNNPAHWEELKKATKDMIDKAAASSVCRDIIVFQGMKWKVADDPKSGELDPEASEKHCVTVLCELAKYARLKGVQLHLEMLNSKEDPDTWRGHPGFQGDNIDVTARIVQEVRGRGHTNVWLLFDVYHVAIHHSDLLELIRKYASITGHYHMAQFPGRSPIHEKGDIDYQAVVETIRSTGYRGVIAQEFIPKNNPEEELKNSAHLVRIVYTDLP